ncbi:hypothetical protein H8D91_00360, partial [archaeon]|nr:hypothetical protein [archaeon]
MVLETREKTPLTEQWKKAASIEFYKLHPRSLPFPLSTKEQEEKDRYVENYIQVRIEDRQRGFATLTELVQGETELRVPKEFLCSPTQTKAFTTAPWMRDCFRYAGMYAVLKEETLDRTVKQLAT